MCSGGDTRCDDDSLDSGHRSADVAVEDLACGYCQVEQFSIPFEATVDDPCSVDGRDAVCAWHNLLESVCGGASSLSNAPMFGSVSFATATAEVQCFPRSHICT